MPLESILKQKNRKDFYHKIFSYNGVLHPNQTYTLSELELLFEQEKMMFPRRLYDANSKAYFIGKYVLSLFEYTQLLIAQQKLAVQKEIINNELGSLIKLLQILYKDNYPNDYLSNTINEYWNFLRDAFEEAIIYQFSLNNIKARYIQYRFYDKIVRGYSIEFTVKLQKNNYERRLQRITPNANIKALDNFFAELATESQRNYLQNTQRTWSKTGLTILIILTVSMLILNMPEASLFFVVIGTIINYVYSIYCREIRPAVRQKILATAAIIDSKFEIDEKDASREMVLAAAQAIAEHGDPARKYTKKEIVVAGKSYTIYSNNTSNEGVASAFLTDNSDNIANLRNLYPLKKNTIQSMADSKFLSVKLAKSNTKKDWLLPEKEDGAIILGEKKYNPDSCIYVTFSNNKEKDSALIEKIQSGRYGFAAKRGEIGFKFMKQNHYTLKEMDGTRWDFFKQGNITIKNTDGETKNMPHYVSGQIRYK